jgi:hypothetical protein
MDQVWAEERKVIFASRKGRVFDYSSEVISRSSQFHRGSELPSPPGSLCPRRTTGQPSGVISILPNFLPASTGSSSSGPSRVPVYIATAASTPVTHPPDWIQGAHLRDKAYRSALSRISTLTPLTRSVLVDLSLLGKWEVRSITSLS